MVHVDGVGRLGPWAPDSSRVLADDGQTFRVVDRSCCGAINIVAQDAGWVSSSSIAALVGSVDEGHVRLYDLAGTETSQIDDTFESVVFGPGTGDFAGIVPLVGSDPTSLTYRIWDQGTMSDPLPGEPLAWSADGSQLVVLKPTETGKVVDLGTLSIVDKSGHELLAIPNWVATTWAPYVFSPDGRYLAACLQPADALRTAPEIHVIDLKSGTVSGNVGQNCIDFGTTWGPDSNLFVSDATGRPPVVWTRQGTSRLETTYGWATPALNGNLALWSDGMDNTTVELRVGDTSVKYPMPQLHSVTWSPDGRTLAAISRLADVGMGLTLIPATGVP